MPEQAETPNTAGVAAGPSVDRPLVWFTGLSATSVLLPFVFFAFFEAPWQSWLAVLGFILILPYLHAIWRLLRAPGRREGPGLAAGVAATIAVPGALALALEMEQRNYVLAVCVSCMLLFHVLTVGFGIVGFRNASSDKPAWRIVVRSLLDPIIYYGILFVLLMGSIGLHHR